MVILYKRVILCGLVALARLQMSCAETAAGNDSLGRKCLENYSKVLDCLERSFVEYEASAKTVGAYGKPFTHLTGKLNERYFSGSMAVDGERYSLRTYMWGHVKGLNRFQARERAGYESILWRPDYFHQYRSGSTPGLVITSWNPKDFQQFKRLPYEGKYAGQFMLGYFGEHVAPVRLDKLLNRQNCKIGHDSTSGTSLIVITSQNEFGAVTAQFEAKEPFNLLRMDTVKNSGNLYYNDQLPTNNRITCRADFSDFQNVGGTTFPMSGTTIVHHAMPNGEYRKFEQSFRTKRLVHGSGVEKLQAFEANDIPKGATVEVLGKKQRPDAGKNSQNIPSLGHDSE